MSPKQLKLKDLQAADILLLAGKDDFSKSVADYMRSDYSHAALWTGNDHQMIDATLDGVRRASPQYSAFEHIDVYRHKELDAKDTAPKRKLIVQKAIADYVGRKYDIGAATVATFLLMLARRYGDAVFTLARQVLGDEDIDAAEKALTCTEVVVRPYIAHGLALEVEEDVSQGGSVWALVKALKHLLRLRVFPQAGGGTEETVAPVGDPAPAVLPAVDLLRAFPRSALEDLERRVAAKAPSSGPLDVQKLIDMLEDLEAPVVRLDEAWLERRDAGASAPAPALHTEAEGGAVELPPAEAVAAVAFTEWDVGTEWSPSLVTPRHLATSSSLHLVGRLFPPKPDPA